MSAMDFENIYNSHFDTIFKFIYRFLGDRHQAEDLAQETFVRLYEHLNNDNNILNPTSWLYRVAANLCNNQVKRKGILYRILAQNNFQDNHVDDNFEDNFIQSEEVKRVRKALQRLSDRDQILLQLYQDGLSYKEMADVTGIKYASVGKLLARAIANCAHQLEKDQ